MTQFSGAGALAALALTSTAYAQPSCLPSQPVTLQMGEPMSVRAGDMDGDGDIDVVAAGRGQPNVAWFENDGASPPGFEPHPIVTELRQSTSIEPADIDADGDLDLVVGSLSTRPVLVLLNDGSSEPAFTELLLELPLTVSPTEATTADVDGDGDLDVVSAAQVPGGDEFYWFANDGMAPPSFERMAIPHDRGGPDEIEAADLDGDGDVDFATSLPNLGNTGVDWFANDGQPIPMFVQERVETFVTFVRAPEIADLDGDGALDLLYGEPSRFRWFANLGDGAVPRFELRASVSADNTTDLHAVDLDLDGNIDVLTAEEDPARVAWFVNAGDGPDSRDEGILLADELASPQSVFTADVDGDGRPDVLAASSSDNRIGLFLNRLSTPTLTLSRQPDLLVGGETATFTVTSAEPGEEVVLLGSEGVALGAPLPPLGGRCLLLEGEPLVVGRAVADSSGTAELVIRVPDDEELRQYYHQATSVRGVDGSESTVSNAVRSSIVH